MINRSRTLLGVALVATFLVTLISPLRQVSALNCKDINIVFARGSSQNYSIPTNKDQNFPDWGINPSGSVEFIDFRTNKNDPSEAAFVTKEKESAKYFEGIGNRVLKEYPTLTMQFVSLHDFAGKYNQNGYRAVPAFGSINSAFLSRNAIDARFGYSSIIGESTYGDYRQSVQDGAQELAGYLADEMARCPSQYTVLGGYSQGAQVVGDAIDLMHTRNQDNLLSRLGHVDLFGDPKFNGFKLSTSRLNPVQLHTTYPWVRGSANMNEVGSLGPREPYVPDILTSRTTSWCDFNDLVCGGYAGLSVTDFQAHGHVYSDSSGWIEKSANETYIAMKQRLSLLAGVSDKSANSPLAYWPGISEPSKLDVMFVMDQTGDESLSLSPDPDYLSNNFGYLANPLAPNGIKTEDYYSSIQAGVATYTEFQEGDDAISYPKVPVGLTTDIFSEFGAFRSGWAQSHFLGNYYGGADLQDSPYSSLKLALDQPWRSDARKVIVLFSNSYGKSTEPGTNLTMKQITAKARAKHVEILPVFTSRTFRANANNVQFVPAANAFYAALAKQSKGHAAEVTDALSRTLVYDVIMGHIYAPDVVLTTGRNKNLSDKKMIVKKGKKITLSAGKSNSPKSTIKHYAWDMNGDGIIDHESDDPYVEHTYDGTFDGQVCVTITDSENISTTGCEDIASTDDDSQVTDTDPAVLNAPNFHTARTGNDLVITWPPVAGYIIFRDADGAIIEFVDGTNGTFTIHDVPTGAFDISGQLIQGDDESETVVLHIAASIPIPAPTVTNDDEQDPPETVTPVVADLTEDTDTDGTIVDVPQETTLLLASDEAQPISINPQQVLGVTDEKAGISQLETIFQEETSIPVDGQVGLQRAEDSTSGSHTFGVVGSMKKATGKLADFIEGVVQDYLAWLILMLLLLIWLYLNKRKREVASYHHERQKRYVSRKVVSLGV